LSSSSYRNEKKNILIRERFGKRISQVLVFLQIKDDNLVFYNIMQILGKKKVMKCKFGSFINDNLYSHQI